jgi:hypothetical protein
MQTHTQNDPSFIDPNRLYTVRGFHAVSGISETRVRLAKRHDVVLPTIEVGKRKFIRGVDAIAYIERLSTLPKEATQAIRFAGGGFNVFKKPATEGAARPFTSGSR